MDDNADDDKKLEEFELPPNKLIRMCDGEEVWGLGQSAIKEKVEDGELPAPFPLSDTGRALAWYGWQVNAHRRRMMDKAKVELARKAEAKRLAKLARRKASPLMA